MVLPSFRSVTSGISTDRLVSSVRDIEIESQVGDEDEIQSTDGEGTVDVKAEQRQEHACLIKDMLVYINFEYKKRYGVPGDKKGRLGPRTLMGPGVPGIQRPLLSVDVEMAVV